MAKKCKFAANIIIIKVMYNFPIDYNEPLFRPPSEGNSLIIQVTLGCSWNNCAFCEMYTSKSFKARNEADIFADIDVFIPYANNIRRIFLADGDAMVLSANKLLRILQKLKSTFPRLQRISTYASPSNLESKTLEDLKMLSEAGLSLIYVGLESGDSEVLRLANKGAEPEQMINALNKSQSAGINTSVMIINGLGGKEFTEQHAINSAKVVNAIQPKYLSTLVLTAYRGMDYLKSRLNHDFTELNSTELLQELRLFIDNLELKETIFRTDHASNFMVLKGAIPRDKQKFIKQIDDVLLS